MPRNIMIQQTPTGWRSEYSLREDWPDPLIRVRCIDCHEERELRFIQPPGRPMLEQAALAATVQGCPECGGPVEAEIVGHGV